MAVYQFKNDDVICSCKGITQKKFLAAIEAEKISSLEQAREKTGVNISCGMCIYIVEKLITEHAPT